MEEKNMVKDIMAPIDEYEKIDEDSHLGDALSILKKKYEGQKTGNTAIFHKTMFVTDASKKIVGKLSMYDLIRELVPETAREPEVSRAFYSALSSRVLEVTEEVSEFQQRFQWLHHSFRELVKQEAHKKVKNIMSQVHPILKESDTINQTIYVMFKENIRQPLVVRDGEIIGVMDFMHIFDELIETIV